MKDARTAYKFGFDIHGVLNKHPALCAMTHALYAAGHEVHIITGKKYDGLLIDELVQLDLGSITAIYSITSDLAAKGHDMHWDKKGSPHVNKKLWDKAKADYCRKYKIDFMIDDMEQYAKYFTTPIAVVKGRK